ncbi:hypothetical protein TNCV_3012711 [Trichonephila clavipes]|nr:hypothetical protein TNCV_3012711 [Trichonephila clavipes]
MGYAAVSPSVSRRQQRTGIKTLTTGPNRDPFRLSRLRSKFEVSVFDIVIWEEVLFDIMYGRKSGYVQLIRPLLGPWAHNEQTATVKPSSLEKEVHRLGLKINENKTKYMPYTKSCFNNSHFKVVEYIFEVVDSYTHLSSAINNRNDCTIEIQKRITMAKRCLNGI